MKLKCDVCKTEYNLPSNTYGEVRCAVCGHTWTAKPPVRKSGLMLFFASLCALLAATVFVVAVVVTSRRDNPEKTPLVAVINDIQTVTTDGASQVIVSGMVTNRSDDFHGLPDLRIVLYDEAGTPIARQYFMPSATFLDPGQSVNFTHKLTGDVSGVKRVTVELVDKRDKK